LVFCWINIIDSLSPISKLAVTSPRRIERYSDRGHRLLAFRSFLPSRSGKDSRFTRSASATKLTVTFSGR